MAVTTDEREQRLPKSDKPPATDGGRPVPGATGTGAAPAGVMTMARGLRGLLVGLVLVVLLSALTLHSNLRYGRYITAASLPNGAVFMFVVALVGNALVRRLRPAAALSLGELALVFSMLYISAALPQASIAETLVTLAVAPAHFPRASPHLEKFEGEVPAWLIVQSEEARRLFYEGLETTGDSIPWSVWIVPLLGWSVFVALLLVALYCLSRVFAHRWIREERVTFPLMELPLELMASHGRRDPLWRSRLMWMGAAIPAATILMGQLHSYYPWLPEWQQIIEFKVGEGFTEPPLTVLRDFRITFWPLVIGISYMLNAEIAMSIWVFHLLFWAQLLAWAVAGYNYQAETGGGAFNPLDWIHDMEFGGALVLSGVIFWSVRSDVTRTGRALLRRERGVDLPVSPGVVLGFLLANAGMLLWGWAAGASVLAVGGFLVFLYAIVIALGRMVAAGGLYLVDNGYTPQPLLYGLGGVGAFSNGSHFLLTGQEALVGRADMSFLYFATNDSKFAHDTGTENRRHGLGVVIAVAAALLAAYVFILWWSYQYGASTFRAWPFSWNATGMFDRVAGFMSAARGPNEWTYLGIATGVVVAVLLVTLNRRYLWWGLSPFGFVVASSWNISNQIWSSVFTGWLLAGLVRRFGGLKIYRLLRPFFLGLILGDAVTYCLVVLLESVVGVRGAGR